MWWIKSITVSQKVWEKLSENEKEDKFVIGQFTNKDRLEYTERYKEVIKKAQKMWGNK